LFVILSSLRGSEQGANPRQSSGVFWEYEQYNKTVQFRALFLLAFLLAGNFVIRCRINALTFKE
jgi:hypothetical protein